MQTFLPYPSFTESAHVLDSRRLGKQRVEAYQILRTLRGLTHGWARHPAVRMWAGYEAALAEYHDAMVREWIKRGYRNTMLLQAHGHKAPGPPWLGDARVHESHRSNLLRKEPKHYRQFWPLLRDDLAYVWPLGTPQGGLENGRQDLDL